jgi:hypothetical protein
LWQLRHADLSYDDSAIAVFDEGDLMYVNIAMRLCIASGCWKLKSRSDLTARTSALSTSSVYL